MTDEPAWRTRLDEARLALAYLTRLPVGSRPLPEMPLAGAVWAFPLVGLLIGLLAVIAAAGASGLGLPPLLIAIAALGAAVLATGALHEDGLADCADGLGGGDPQRRRAIMRDSRIGTYGVLALILAMLAKAGALAALAADGWLGAGFVAAAAASRGLLPVLMYALPPAPGDGEGRSAGAVTLPLALAAGGLGLLIAMAATGLAGLLAVLAALAATLGVGYLARARLGGYTGDVLGAAQQIAELVMLVTLAAIAA